MIEKTVAALVETSRRYAVPLVLALLVLSILGAYFTASHLSFNTDFDKLISADLPWRQRDAEMDRAFPQNTDLLAVVVDATTPDLADDATSVLARRLGDMKELFHSVREPEGGPYFHREGMLFLPLAAVQAFCDQIIEAQPMIGTLAADPSLRGIFDAIDLLAKGAAHGDIDESALASPLAAVKQSVEAALQGRFAPLSWQNMLTGRKPDPRELRRFILTQPVLDYEALQPGAAATAAVREAATSLGLTPERGVRVRLTGSVAFSDDQLATLSHGAAFTTALSLSLLCLWLFMALRSPRLVAAIVATLIVGLVACGTFALGVVGPLNPISAAFAVLFIGLAIDFGIQFSVRYRDERHSTDDLPRALARTAAGVGPALGLAAIATSVGFFSFVPTDYTGVSDLGLIAGTGMLIALVLNLTLLPALLALLKPGSERREIGYAALAPLNRALLARRTPVLAAAGVIGLAAAAALSWLRFDFNPLDLQNQHTEAMRVLNELKSDPTDTPYTIEILAPSVDAATALAQRLDRVPEVGAAVTITSFVPGDQDQKLALLADASSLLGPTLSPPQPKPAPSPAQVAATLAQCIKDLDAAGAKGIASASSMADALRAAEQKGEAALPGLDANLVTGLKERLDDLRQALAAQPVTLATLPDDIKRDWLTSDGRARVQVFPKGGAPDNEAIRRFVAAVRAVAPEATGTPVTIQESANTVTRAFAVAGALATAAIALLLYVVLRRVRDVALVLVPLGFAGLLTLGTAATVGMPLNFANIITLPLMLGIGVAFDVYFVMRWRGGDDELLQSSTARAILFSALATGTAFGSLAISDHPGTAEMGKLLSLALFYTLAATFLVLPALMGPAGSRPKQP
ncbi:MAG TPA: MMPL family transporter [Stellaceae bacterium]|nr:MMPL family transporter [Stellaceae bacterium]